MQVFVMLASLEAKDKGAICDLLVVCDFQEVFPKGIINLPPEHEVEFPIDLVPSTSSMSMAPSNVWFRLEWAEEAIRGFAWEEVCLAKRFADVASQEERW